MAAVKALNAVARREGDWWVVEVEAGGVTQAERLDHVDHVAKDMVAIMEDIDSSEIQVDVDARISDELERLRAEAEEADPRGGGPCREGPVGQGGRDAHLEEMAKLSASDIGRLTGVSMSGRPAIGRKHRRWRPSTERRTRRLVGTQTEPKLQTDGSQ